MSVCPGAHTFSKSTAPGTLVTPKRSGKADKTDVGVPEMCPRSPLDLIGCTMARPTGSFKKFEEENEISLSCHRHAAAYPAILSAFFLQSYANPIICTVTPRTGAYRMPMELEAH
ncbi:predicted protein [Pyrenophora tritici-repentis Pt-1C-BFP]|uniref:Uncharacterized protein n=1 Tax=Pyrenophora tritici-repentis (strain Pt-1C-BFP) TaxID=426418 RepID=B2WHL3_PYRTR|nr:uncharacterized protein PTRG_09472 [Pyrenophora tritici-repentis Pt-1C-BFP]EDU42523.1 predicted protein [Pyrenophora tritici-repentis Pt-1C-BFP]